MKTITTRKFLKWERIGPEEYGAATPAGLLIKHEYDPGIGDGARAKALTFVPGLTLDSVAPSETSQVCEDGDPPCGDDECERRHEPVFEVVDGKLADLAGWLHERSTADEPDPRWGIFQLIYAGDPYAVSNLGNDMSADDDLVINGLIEPACRRGADARSWQTARGCELAAFMKDKLGGALAMGVDARRPILRSDLVQIEDILQALAEGHDPSVDVSTYERLLEVIGAPLDRTVTR